MNVEHDYSSLDERKIVCDWVDAELGLDFEVTESDEGFEGTILIFDVEPAEFHKMMDMLEEKGYNE